MVVHDTSGHDISGRDTSGRDTSGRDALGHVASFQHPASLQQVPHYEDTAPSIATRMNTGGPHLVGYLPALYPDAEHYRALLASCAANGLQFIEIGIPSENAYLDGTIIRDALALAAANSQTRGQDIETLICDSVKAVEEAGLCGIVMLYQETYQSIGPEQFAHLCKKAHIRAVLIANIEPQTRRTLHTLLSGTDTAVVNFIPYGTPEHEIAHIVEDTTAFVYVQSMHGATGGTFTADDTLARQIERVKRIAAERNLPVALGFGISTPDTVRSAASLGPDAVIVGTACVSAAEHGPKHLGAYLRTINLKPQEGL